MRYFATKHLKYRASGLVEGSIEPWVRTYMNDHDGDWAYWCQGFVCTILDQAFSIIGEYFSEYYANEVMRKKSRKKKLLATQR